MNLITLNTYLVSALFTAFFITSLIHRIHQSAIIVKALITLIICFAWIVLSYFEISLLDFNTKLIISNLKYTGVAILPYFWLLFGLECRKDHSGKSWHPIVNYLWIPGLITFILVWFDPALGLVRENFSLREVNGIVLLDRDYGPWFWVHIVYSYMLYIGGGISIIQSIDSKRYRLNQRLILLLAIALPFVISALYVSNLFPDIPDPTPVSFSITAALLIFSHNTFRHLYTIGYARELIIESIHNPILFLNTDSQLIYANRRAYDVLGIDKTALGANLMALNTILSPVDARSFTGYYEAYIHDSKTGTYYELHSTSSILHLMSKGFIITLYDVTERMNIEEVLTKQNAALTKLAEQRTQELSDSNRDLRLELERRVHIEAKLAHDAIHDPLTGLGNRNALNGTLKRAAADYQRDSTRSYCVFYIDFDGFKEVNDNFGHDIGDQFLIRTARRLERTMRETDSVCRVGGDEFVVILSSMENSETAVLAIQRIYSEVTQPMLLNKHNLTPSMSIGVAFAAEGIAPEAVLKNADIAMYQAKSDGKNQWAIFNESMKAQNIKKSQIVTELKTAIQENTIYPVFQSIVDKDGSIVGWEALARWKHKTLGEISTEQFIQAAEDTNLIKELGSLILSKTLETATEIIAIDPNKDFYFSVNVSPSQLLFPSFRGFLKSQLQAFDLPSSILRLEIAEITYSENIGPLTDIIKKIQADDGIKFILDDFGAMNLPFSLLDRVSFEIIKIDTAITQKMSTSDNEKNSSFMDGVISLGKIFGKQVLIEGVEGERQAQKLWAMGADYCQGWYFGTALSAEELKDWYTAQNHQNKD